jgi:hypothetical protein
VNFQVRSLFSKLMASLPSLTYVACNLGEALAQEQLKKEERNQRAVHNWTFQLFRDDSTIDGADSAIHVQDPHGLTKVPGQAHQKFPTCNTFLRKF